MIEIIIARRAAQDKRPSEPEGTAWKNQPNYLRNFLILAAQHMGMQLVPR